MTLASYTWNIPHVMEYRLRNEGNICLCNLDSWALGSRIQLKESGIPLTIGIRNPSSSDKESEIQYLESGIHGVESSPESRIQNSSLSWIPLHGAKTVASTKVSRNLNHNEDSWLLTAGQWVKEQLIAHGWWQNKNATQSKEDVTNNHTSV